MIKVLEQCSLGLAIHTQDHLKMVEHCQFSMQIRWILIPSKYDLATSIELILLIFTCFYLKYNKKKFIK